MRDEERDIEIAALETFGDGGAGGDLQPLPAGRHPAPHIEAAGVDALDLPPPTEPAILSLGAGKARHAGNGHRALYIL